MEYFNNQISKYGLSNNRIITKNHSLKVFLDGVTEQIEISKSLENFITSQKYKKFAKQAREQFIQQVVNKSTVFMEEQCYKYDFDIIRANTDLDVFKNNTEKKNCTFIVRIKKKFNNSFKLGFLYPSKFYNGKNIDFSVENAETYAKQNKLNKKDIITNNIIVQKNKFSSEYFLKQLKQAKTVEEKLQLLAPLDTYSKTQYINRLKFDLRNPVVIKWMEKNMSKEWLQKHFNFESLKVNEFLPETELFIEEENQFVNKMIEKNTKDKQSRLDEPTILKN